MTACRYAKAWFRKAEALRALGRLPGAIAAAERAAELDANNAGASELLAGLLAQLSRSRGRRDATVRVQVRQAYAEVL